MIHAAEPPGDLSRWYESLALSGAEAAEKMQEPPAAQQLSAAALAKKENQMSHDLATCFGPGIFRKPD